jgi:polyisoprenoid-binding protein YceI
MEWLIDGDNTKVDFSIKELWGLMTVRGSFKGVQGYFNFDPANPSGWSAQAKIETASLTTRNARRDKDLRSARFLDVTNYPYLTFRSVRVEQTAAGTFRLYGELTIRNVTRPVTLEVTYTPTSQNGKASFQATTSITRQDFGLNSKMPMGSEIQISIEVAALKMAPVAGQNSPKVTQVL